MCACLGIACGAADERLTLSLAICSVERSEVADNAYNIVPLDSEEPPFNGRTGTEANGLRKARQ